MLYLILSSNYLKIGYSKNTKKRLLAYNTCNPDYILLDVVRGTIKDETEFHKEISHYCYKTEWFYFNQNIIDLWNTKFNRQITFHQRAWKSQKAKSLYLWLCNHEKNNKVLLSTGIRSELSKELNMSQSCITNNLKTLKNSELIFGEKGTFIINPKFYWRGNAEDKQIVIDEINTKYKNS